MDEKCVICGQELRPAEFAQLQFDGSWCCQSCTTAGLVDVPDRREYEKRDA